MKQEGSIQDLARKVDIACIYGSWARVQLFYGVRCVSMLEPESPRRRRLEYGSGVVIC